MWLARAIGVRLPLVRFADHADVVRAGGSFRGDAVAFLVGPV